MKTLMVHGSGLQAVVVSAMSEMCLDFYNICVYCHVPLQMEKLGRCAWNRKIMLNPKP